MASQPTALGNCSTASPIPRTSPLPGFGASSNIRSSMDETLGEARMKARTFGFAAALILAALCPGLSRSAGLALDRPRTLEQVLADCDPQTGLPHGVAPPAAAGGPKRRVVINPDWLRRPSAGDIASAYPADARAARVSGRAVVQCVAGADGLTHDCQIAEEAPMGKGFGDAALKLAALTLYVPRRVDCAPVDGGRVAMPFSFAP
jgi:TonB family protein